LCFISVNGAFGVDFSNPNITQNDIIKNVSSRLPQHGVTSFCPTIISSSFDTYCKILPLIGPLCQCCEKEKDQGRNNDDNIVGANILGLHLEGPFFAISKKGAHSEEHIHDPTAATTTTTEHTYGISMSSPKKNDGIVIVTLAPERPGAISLIKELSNQNVVVAMGHTDATLAEGIEGVTSGATLITHLFNAMNPFHHREPGMLGMLMLDDDDGSDGNDESHNSVSTNKNENGPVTSDRNISKHRPYFSLIVDGIHSHPSAVKLAHRLHPNGCVLVTDAMSAMGLGDGTHTLGTMKVDIKGNRATVSGTNTLAGSVVSMDSCVKSYRKFTKCSVGEAIRAATLHPAKVLGIDNRKGRICAGYDADLTLLGVDELDVMGTWVGGKKEFDNISSAVCFGGSKKRKIEQS